MVTIERGFPVKDVNDYKLVTERREREKDGKKLVEKLKKVVYKNPKIVTWGFVKRITQENAPEVLKNVEVFEIPNPYDYCKEDKHYNNLTWNLEQAVLALKEGYADGFFTSNGLFGSSTNAFKVVDPIQAVKVRNYFLEDFKGWIEQIEKNPFTYVATITTAMSTQEIGISKDAEDNLTDPKALSAMIEKLQRWDRERVEAGGTYKPDAFDEGTLEHRARKLLEHVYYRSNFKNIWGDWLADFLDFDTLKEAADFAKWLRRPNDGGYSGEEFINDGAMLVNHGFQDWLSKQRAA